MADIARHYHRSVRWVQKQRTAGKLPSPLAIDRNRWLKVAIVRADEKQSSMTIEVGAKSSEYLYAHDGLFDERGRTVRPSRRKEVRRG